MTNINKSPQPIDKPEMYKANKQDGQHNEAFEHEAPASPTGHNNSSNDSQRVEVVAAAAAATPIANEDEYEEKETTIEFSSITSDANMMVYDVQAGKLSGNLASTTIDGPLFAARAANNDKRTGEQAIDVPISESESTIRLAESGDDDVAGALAPPRDDGFIISWHNLDYVVESKWYRLTKQRKPILSNLSGSFRSGELSAVLGPSGAGKSTLMDCLLGKRTGGVTGRTQVSFSSPTLDRERRSGRPLRIATIPQEDHLLETLTVTETFMFASRIKNAHITYDDQSNQSYDDNQFGYDQNKKKKQLQPNRKDRKLFDHIANVQRVIQQLNLSSCASLKCGKLSGGQYKRVSIGQELLSRPDLMILDEPTSGLDSVTCYQTINALRQLIDSSAYPIAIVATIHQPDIEVFNLFHKAYVLASGGRAIYEGPTDGIFRTVRLASKLVEARQPHSLQKANLLPAPNGSIGGGSVNAGSPLDGLKVQLDQPKGLAGNPARLIVEVAAGEYGFEIIGAMAELQSRSHQIVKSSQLGVQGSDSSSSSSDNSISSGSFGTGRGTGNGEIQIDLESIISNEVAPGSDGKKVQPPPFDYNFHDPAKRRPNLDKLLNASKVINSSNNSVRVYLKHLILHTKRSWITIVRDPMLFSLQLLLHVLVPLLISYSFMNQQGYDACPRVGPLDVIDEAYSPGNLLDDLNTEVRSAFENLGYMFFQLYVIIFAAVCVTSLTYPLVMHVLLKEYRNGWYSMSSYFLGRTLADLPVPTANVILAMAISYHLTGQPSSPYHWRFASVAALTVLATLVAQTQGLMFGAMLMNLPQSAVFVAPASTAPLVVVSGFLLRIKSLPMPLQILSQLSYFTHLLNGFLISRYGFNRCPCDEEQFTLDPERSMPAQARGIMSIWVDSFRPEYVPDNNGTEALAFNDTINSRKVDVIGKLVDTVTRAKVFGHDISDCSQVKPFAMLDYGLNDWDLITCFAALVTMLFAFRFATFIVLSWKINSSI